MGAVCYLGINAADPRKCKITGIANGIGNGCDYLFAQRWMLIEEKHSLHVQGHVFAIVQFIESATSFEKKG